MQSGTITERGVDILYWLIAAVLLFLWIKLLVKKREPEKSVILMFGVVFAMAVLSLVTVLCHSPIHRAAVIEKSILSAAFLVFTVTEWICYRKKIK